MSSKIASAGWRYARCGPFAEVLQYGKFDLVPATGEAVVQMIAAPLHRVDSAVVNGSVLGHKRVSMKPFPRIGGCEGVGRVIQAPAKTAATAAAAGSTVKEGDLVWVVPMEGTWATHIAAPLTQLHRIDPAHQQLAITATNFLMAQQLLDGYARLHKGDVVIQNGGSSLTSLAVSVLAKSYGTSVLTAASPGSRYAAAEERHKAAGATVFAYNGAGARAMRAAVGTSGAALYLNGVGGRYFDSLLKCCGPLSNVVTYGAQNGFGLFMSGSNMIYNEVTMSGLFAPTYLRGLSYAERQTKLDFVLKAMAEAKFAYPTVPAASLEKLPAVWDDVFVRGGAKGIVTISS